MRSLLIAFFSVLLAWFTLCSHNGNDNRNNQYGQNSLNVVILGDSNCWIGGDNCDKERGWTMWFKQDFKPASCCSFARSGATWTNTPKTVRNESDYTELLSDQNVIYNQVCRLRTSCSAGVQPVPDIIIIAAGTNDAWFTKRRPNVFDKNASVVFADTLSFISRPPSEMVSLAEAVRFNCELLRDAFPNAQIILLTPMECTVTSVASINRVGDIIEDCANLMSIPVIRQDYFGCVKSDDEQRNRHFTTDGVHTSRDGAQCMGNFLTSEIKRIIIH